MTIKTRFAPSPTGLLHIGNIRIALINWLYARNKCGKFLLRIDDTDMERSQKHYESEIKRDLQWLGINWDESFNQSTRSDLYIKAKLHLISTGRLYACYETQDELEMDKKAQINSGNPPIYNRRGLSITSEDRERLELQGRQKYWRFKMDDTKITWQDAVKGKVTFDGGKISDPILFKADGSVTYTMASVVDDIESGITSIIRGEDHLTNSAIHMQLFEALNAAYIPEFGHISLIYSKDGEISKRLGGFDISAMRKQGIESVAILNYLSQIGTASSTGKLLSIKDIIEEFDISKFSSGNVQFNSNEIKLINKKIIKNIEYCEVKDRLNGISEDFWYSVRGNLDVVEDAISLHKICSDKFSPIIAKDDLDIVNKVALILEKNECEVYNKLCDDVSQSLGRGVPKKRIFHALRMAISGMKSGPELSVLFKFIGKERVLARLKGHEV